MLDNRAYYDLNTENVLGLSEVAYNAGFKALIAATYYDQQQTMLNLDPSDENFKLNYTIEQTKLRCIHSLNLWVQELQKRLDAFKETGELPDVAPVSDFED